MFRSLRIPLCFLLLLTSCAKKSVIKPEGDAATAMQTCNKLLEKDDHEAASKCYETVRARFGSAAVSEEAELKLADIAFDKKEYLVAAESYRAFAKMHPSHPQLPYVYQRGGLSYLKESPKAIDRDQQYLEDAIGYFEICMRYFPDSPYAKDCEAGWKEARGRLAAHELYVGRFYYKNKEYQSSLPRFARVADEFKDLPESEPALYWLSQALLKLNKKDQAFTAASELKQRYPNSKYLNRLIKDLKLD